MFDVVDSLNRVEISLSALKNNFYLLKEQAPGIPILAMVKADAYGHGMTACARALSSLGVEGFGVAEMAEGVKLRVQDIHEPVFIMAGVVPQTIIPLFEHKLTPVLVDDTCLQCLSREAVQRNTVMSVHVKVDAGMGRQGLLLADLPHILRIINLLPGIALGGIMAHFPMADDPFSDSTAAIFTSFFDQLKKCQEYLPPDLQIHLANSGGILYFNQTHCDMIRPGLSLYGYYPDGYKGRQQSRFHLQPVMRFTSRIIQLKDVPTGTGLGYGHSFTTQRPSKIAIIPVGYEDGYLRCLSNKAMGLVHGYKVPTVGRISMNLTMFDVTEVDNVFPGDECVLMGRQGQEEITADDIACWMETINYEVLCLFGNLNHRVYVEQ